MSHEQNSREDNGGDAGFQPSDNVSQLRTYLMPLTTRIHHDLIDMSEELEPWVESFIDIIESGCPDGRYDQDVNEVQSVMSCVESYRSTFSLYRDLLSRMEKSLSRYARGAYCAIMSRKDIEAKTTSTVTIVNRNLRIGVSV